MKTCRCLQHVPFEGPGRLGSLLADLGYRVETRLVPADDLPPDAGDFLLVMGGPMSVNDPDRWIERETDFIRNAVRSGTPCLGICLGSQFLAKAMGGRIAPGRVTEVGMTPLRRTPAGREDPAFRLFPQAFHAFAWHGEGIELPAGCVNLAASDGYDVQAFRSGSKAYGFLFHVEVGPENVAALCRHCPEDLVRARRAGPEVQAEAEAHFPSMHGHLRAFLGALLA